MIGKVTEVNKDSDNKRMRGELTLQLRADYPIRCLYKFSRVLKFCAKTEGKTGLMYHVCEQCGKGFDARTNNEHYCSEKCKKRHYYLLNRKSTAPQETRVCEECGKLFRPKTKRSRFCTRECAEKNRHRRDYNAKRTRILEKKTEPEEGES